MGWLFFNRICDKVLERLKTNRTRARSALGVSGWDPKLPALEDTVTQHQQLAPSLLPVMNPRQWGESRPQSKQVGLP